ncbi:hypothetical protein BJX76DRAFT_358095 [Aspergillus varians]
MPEPTQFTFNVAFTIPINPPSQPTLTFDEFWRGLRRGGDSPHLFAPYVEATEILPGAKSKNEFQRRLILADGAVHTAKGEELVQNVRNADGLLTEATTITTGARTTMVMARGGSEGDGPDSLYLTAIYELHVPDVVPGSDRAKEIERDYAQLAKGAAHTVVDTVRRWKLEGALQEE